MIRQVLLAALALFAACSPAVQAAPDCRSAADCGAEERCEAGSCVPLVLSCEPHTACASGCTDLAVDPANCGACNAACEEGHGCLQGSCCPDEAPLVCAGACVDPSTNGEHCGGCGIRCAPGETCSEGTCCMQGEQSCGGVCVDTTSHPADCGGCGVHCPAGAPCAAGSCGACPAGLVVVECGTVEVCLPPERAVQPCMALVHAATFEMGDPAYVDAPVHQVTITSDFLMDVLEVTQADWQRCLDAGACGAPESIHAELTPDEPVSYVTWEQAVAFCAWRGGALPTEAQWELAARSTDGRRYPWGNEPSGDGPLCRAAYDGCSSGVQRVGSFPTGRSADGVLDLAANVKEWTADWYAPYPATAVTDPLGPADPPAGSVAQKVTRGENFEAGPITITSTLRQQRGPADAGQTIGLRCVLPAP